MFFNNLTQVEAPSGLKSAVAENKTIHLYQQGSYGAVPVLTISEANESESITISNCSFIAHGILLNEQNEDEI